MNSLQFPYPEPSYCAITTNVGSACFCVANGTAGNVLVQDLKTIDILSGVVEARSFFQAYDVAKVLYCENSRAFVANARQGIEKIVRVAKVQVDMDNLIEAAQSIEYAYAAGDLTFEQEGNEKLFRKKMKRIDIKNMSLEVEAMLMLFPYLIYKRFDSGEQVSPGEIYI